jgi:hypothetical protein
MNKHPQFVMSMYANKETLYKAKAEHYMHECDKHEKWLAIGVGIQCPACDNVGWYVDGQGEQAQCQFCEECPDSIFNQRK